MDEIEHLTESLELIQEEIDWMLANEWSVEWLREKLQDLRARLDGVRCEVDELGLVMEND